MDIQLHNHFPSVLVGMSMSHLKLSLMNTSSSVSRTEIKLNQTNQQADCIAQKLLAVSVGTWQLNPH